jgi:hypothetical protein
MKITKSQLKQIIKEELEAAMEEGLKDFLNPDPEELDRRRELADMSDEEFEASKDEEHITAHGGLASDEEIPGADEQAKEAEWYSRKGPSSKKRERDKAVRDRRKENK